VADEPFARRTARVLLVDETDRVLLFETYRDYWRRRLGTYWITPGGGVEPGESLAQAAVRELREETGLAVPLGDLGPHVAASSGHADLSWVRGTLRDDYFFHRVPAHAVVIDGFEALERLQTLGHRWWSAEELAASDEDVVPRGLDRLLPRLLAGRIPDEPVTLPWHL